MLSQPINKPVSDGKYELIEPYLYEWVDQSGTLNRIKIQPGFINDGASIPRIFWSVYGLTPDGDIRAAALIHDYILVMKGRLKQAHSKFIAGEWINGNFLLNKKEADRLFRQVAIESGVKKWKVNLAYIVIRAYTKITRKYEWI